MEEVGEIVHDVIRSKNNRANINEETLQHLIQEKLNHSLIKHIQEGDYIKDNKDGILSISFTCVDTNNQTNISVAVGDANPLHNQEKVNTSTLYNISSISSLILTLMILRLIQHNYFEFNTNINTILSKNDLSPHGNEITIESLLSHQSHLKDSGLATLKLMLLTKIIQTVMQRTLNDCLDVLIKNPLEINDIYVIDQYDPSISHAWGYQAGLDVGMQLVNGSDDVIYGATNFRASSGSLAQLMKAFFQGDFIKSGLRDHVIKSFTKSIDHDSGIIGLGLEERNIIIDESTTVRMYSYAGWQKSHAGFLVFCPDDGMVMSCCVSKTHGLADIQQNHIRYHLSRNFNKNPIEIKLNHKHSELYSMGLGCVDLRVTNNDIIDYAIRRGVTIFDTASCYGNGESEIALGQKLINYQRDNFYISSKCGVYFDQHGLHISGSADYIRSACEASLNRLQTHYIDLYYLHRVDPNVCIETSVAELKSLVNEGKIRHIGLSEVTENQLRRAHEIHPIKAVQIEYAPWSRQDEHNGVIAACRELNINVVAYSPLGRGFFTNTDANYFNALPKTDIRKRLPRYCGGNLEFNLNSRMALEKLANKIDCTVAQLVLAWEMKQDMLVIPATTKVKHLDENLAALVINLKDADVLAIDQLLQKVKFAGLRYPGKDVSGIYPENINNSFLSNHKLMLGLGFVTLIGGLFALSRNSERIAAINVDSLINQNKM